MADEPSNPFADVQPARPQPKAFRISAGERRIRDRIPGPKLVARAAKRLQRGDQPPPAKRHGAAVLSNARALEMATVLAEQFYGEITPEKGQAPDLSPYNRKQLTAAWATVMDKFLLLSGRPTQIHAFTDTDRDGMRELARTLVAWPTKSPTQEPA